MDDDTIEICDEDLVYFTKEEIELLEMLNDWVKKFSDLPKQHRSDFSEMQRAVHVLQEKIMIRPVVRAFDRFTNEQENE